MVAPHKPLDFLEFCPARSCSTAKYSEIEAMRNGVAPLHRVPEIPRTL